MANPFRAIEEYKSSFIRNNAENMTADEMALAVDMKPVHVRNYCNNHGIKYKKTRNYERKPYSDPEPKQIIKMKVEPPLEYVRPPANYSNSSAMGIAKQGF